MGQVDLSSGGSGIMTVLGQRFFCMCVEPYDYEGAGGVYRVRLESGWYSLYHRDGTKCFIRHSEVRVDTDPGKAIEEFIPMKFDDPRWREQGLATEITP